MFMDGPFNFDPQRRYPGIFKAPSPPMSANASPPVTTMPAKIPTPSFPSKGPVALPSAPATPASPTSAAVAPAPAPYAYGGPTMSLLSDAQARTDLTPAPGPSAVPRPTVDSIFGDAAGQQPLRRLNPGFGAMAG